MRHSHSDVTPYFDKDTDRIVKGIALVMMFVHHFFTFPGWWLEGIDYPHLEKLAPYFQIPLKLCVPVFCFITGYVYCFNSRKTYRYSLKKITDVLVNYWLVFLLLGAAAVLCGYTYTAKDVALEAFGLTRPTMVFCWYVPCYCLFMLALPLLCRVMGRNVHIDLFLSFFALGFALRVARHFLGSSIVGAMSGYLDSWMPGVLLGYIFARYRLFEKLESLNRRLIRSCAANIAIWLLAAMAVPMMGFFLPRISVSLGRVPIVNRSYAQTINMTAIYAPLFIYAVVNLIRALKVPPLHKMLARIGNCSLLMWFVSCAFFNNAQTVFQPILYFPRNPILVTLWGLLLCYAVSLPLDWIAKRINKRKNTLLFRDL